MTAGLLVTLFVAGLTLANSIGASRVADNASSLHWLNGASAASALARAALAQEITFVGLTERGLATAEDADYARTQTDTAMDRLGALTTSGGSPDVLNRLVGFAAGDIPKLPLNLALLKGASLVGVFLGGLLEKNPQLARENARQLVEWLAAGAIRPHVSGRYPLERGVEAIREVAERRVKGKVLIVPR